MKAVGCILQHGVRRVSAVSALHPYALPFAPRLVFPLRVWCFRSASCSALLSARVWCIRGAVGVSPARVVSPRLCAREEAVWRLKRAAPDSTP